MKNIIVLIVIIISFSCKAQSFIKPIGGTSCPPYDPNCYEKDVNNEFEKFTGTWVYTNGNTTLTFKLKKEEHYQRKNNTNFEDLLVGEYQYIENGVEKVNTLSDFNNPNVLGYRHRISGGGFMHRLPSYCDVDNSLPSEIKVRVQIEDPNDRFVEGYLILRYVNTDGIEKLEVCLYDYTSLADDVNARLPIPDGFYEFVKQ